MGSIQNIDAAWKLSQLADETHCLAVDVVVNSNDVATSPGFRAGSLGLSDDVPAVKFIQKHASSTTFVKLLLPAADGFVVQSDFVSRRLIDCKDVIETADFLQPAQQIKSASTEEYSKFDLPALAARAIGAIVIRLECAWPTAGISTAINDELARRLSFGWLSSEPIPRRRLALIGGRSLSALEGYATAAASLNVGLVIFDESTHWLNAPEWSHMREDFVPFDMTADDSMPQRISDALSKYPKKLDGVMTIEEHLLTIVSKGAALAGMVTSPPESVGMAQNKYQTRQLDNKVYCKRVSCPAELDKLLAEDGPQLEYPLIVKPSRGWASEGVWKVSDEQDLRDKVPRLWRDSFAAWHGSEVVIETFVDGPEVDANMIIIDGDVVFFEVNDDFPSPGDSDTASKFANFVEDSNMIPSKLPQHELDVLEHSLLQSLLKAGFRTGVFHMEARLRHSSCHYARTQDGTTELVRKPDGPRTAGVDVFLLEINPRAPGMQEINATARAYGVSYCSLSLLNALADYGRMKTLSKPFRGGAQYHMQILFVSAEKGGVYQYGDVCAAVLQKHPKLGEHVAECRSFLQDGQEVPDPQSGSMTWVAFFLVFSRSSREEALQVGRRIKELVKEHTDGF